MAAKSVTIRDGLYAQCKPSVHLNLAKLFAHRQSIFFEKGERHNPGDDQMKHMVSGGCGFGGGSCVRDVEVALR